MITVHPLQDAVWQPRMSGRSQLQPEHGFFISGSGYFDPVKACLDRPSLSQACIPCGFACGATFRSLELATRHMFPDTRCPGLAAGLCVSFDISALPKCPLLCADCKFFAIPIKQKFQGSVHFMLHSITGDGIIYSCGLRFPTVYHAIQYTLEAKHVHPQQGQGMSLLSWARHHISYSYHTLKSTGLFEGLVYRSRAFFTWQNCRLQAHKRTSLPVFHIKPIDRTRNKMLFGVHAWGYRHAENIR